MKKLLLILLCVPLLYSCVENEQKKTDERNLSNEITTEMRNDGYTGKGTWISANGAKYVGEYKDGKCHGQGTYTFANGDKYIGEWKDGIRNGQGTFTWQNPWEQYVGEFKDNKKDGQGTYTYTNGESYVGEWKNGNKHGQGTSTNNDGTVYKGLWEYGEFIGEE